MITEIIKINWLLLFAPFLCVLGIAVIVALIGLMEYARASDESTRREFIKKTLFKTGIWISAGLIITGITLFQFKIPSDKLIVVKIEKKKNAAPILFPQQTGSLSFLPEELKIDPKNRSHPRNTGGMRIDTITLLWDGFIQTRFIRFDKGDYTVEFQARGSKADNEFSKIKVEFETPDTGNYLVTTSIRYLELTRDMETYNMNFKTETDTVGRIRITYFNDIEVEDTGEGRDVWVRDFIIKKR